MFAETLGIVSRLYYLKREYNGIFLVNAISNLTRTRNKRYNFEHFDLRTE